MHKAFTGFHHHPFGMLMPGRRYSAGTGYRYGFNGKENDNEVKGEGNQIDYGLRVYDPRVGRFLSVDPIAEDYPSLTPYQFSSNRPIESVDMDGMERVDYRLTMNDGKAQLQYVSTGPTKEHLPGPTIFGWEIYSKDISIPHYVRIEYQGQHYIFDDGGPKSEAAQIPMASAYTTQYDNNVHYAADIDKFKANPDEWITTHESEEQGQLVVEGKLQFAQWMRDATEAYKKAFDEEASQRPSAMQPSTSASTAKNKPATQQKKLASPNVEVKQTNSILKPLGKGSTGRTEARNLSEKLAMEEVMGNPNLGSKVPGMKPLTDKRWSGWYKMQYIKTLGNGTKINVHYNAQMDQSGKIIAIDDFKFKDHK